MVSLAYYPEIAEEMSRFALRKTLAGKIQLSRHTLDMTTEVMSSVCWSE